MLKNGKSIIITTDIVAASLLVISCNAFAETTGSATFSVDIADTILELSVPSNPAVINLNPTMTGTAFGTANVTISAATNNQTGYTITMTPDSYYSDVALVRTELVGDEEDYRRIEALEPTTPASTGYTEETFTSNTWGYRILNNTNYYGIDENNPTISHPAWTTDAPTNGTTHNLTLATKIDATTVSGSYETTLNFSAVTNAVVAKDTITFNGNGADGGDMSSDTIVAPYGTSIILPANKYSKSGHRFIGWNTNTSGTGLSYVDEGEYNPVSSDYSHNITLYAMWSNLPEGASTSGTTPSGNPGVTISRAYEIAYTAAGKGMWEETAEGSGVYTQITDGVYHNRDVRWDMQGMTPEICNSVTVVHDDYRALDIRDWKLYHITKLKDGQCWMTQDLDFHIPTTALSSETTDLTKYDVDAYTASNGYSKNGDIIYWTPTNATTDISSYRNTYEVMSYDLGNWYTTGVYPEGDITIDFINGDTRNVYREDEPFDNGEHGHIGVYYDTAAAMAMNNIGWYARYESGTLNDISKNPQNSVCPRGWRLPIASNYTINDFGTLFGVYDLYISNYGLYPVYLNRSGEVENANHNYARYGYYATTTVADVHWLYGVRFYDLAFGSTGHTIFHPYYQQGIGVPVRCIAR